MLPYLEDTWCCTIYWLKPALIRRYVRTLDSRFEKMDLADVLVSLTTVENNAFFDGLRVLVAIWSGMILMPMLLVARRTKNLGFYALAIFIFISAVRSADLIGEDFILYLTPLRIVGLALATYWMWARRNILITPAMG